MASQAITYHRVELDKIKARLSPEQIVGILVWAVLRGQLTNEVMELARSLPKEYYDGLGDEWWLVAKYVHSQRPLPMDDESLAHHQGMLHMELASISPYHGCREDKND